MLNQLSGLYLHGDSSASLASHEFQATFSYIISYMYERSDVKYDYFPIFMMGASFQSLLLRRLGSTSILKAVPTALTQANLQLRLTMEPADTYLFDELDTNTIDDFL